MSEVTEPGSERVNGIEDGPEIGPVADPKASGRYAMVSVGMNEGRNDSAMRATRLKIVSGCLCLNQSGTENAGMQGGAPAHRDAESEVSRENEEAQTVEAIIDHDFQPNNEKIRAVQRYREKASCSWDPRQVGSAGK